MKHVLATACVLASLLLAACEEDKYPVSGEECGPDDPVKGLDAGDCTIPGPGNVGM